MTKQFPLQPLSRVRVLRLQAAQALVAQRRAEVEQALHRRDVAKQAWSEAVEDRARHQRDCAQATAAASTQDVTWLRRADRHRQLIDAQIEKCVGLLRGADEELDRAREIFAEAFAAMRQAQAKVEALDTFRGEWKRKQQHELDRREEQAGEELYLATAAKR
jgi:hypothetical protein